jgi:hypothetical protein
MKITSRPNSGSILMASLLTCVILGVGLASYMTLVQTQNRFVTRSRTWNSAIPAAEAGIEDALTHLNVIGDGNRAANGWTLSSNLYTVTRDFGNFRYSVGLDSSNQPSITSTGWVQSASGTSGVTRIVRVTTTRYGSGMRGMVAINRITMNGTTEADSFDGENTLYSTGGRYDATKRRDSSFVGSVTGNVDTGGGTIYGIIATGPTGVATGNAGDFTWLASHSGIQSGHYENDLNVAFEPASVPFNGGASFPETALSVVTTNYTYAWTSITTNVSPNPFPAGGVTTNTSTYTVTTYPTGQTGITTNTAMTSSKTYPTAGTYIGSVVTRVVTSGSQSKRGTWYDYLRISGYSYATTVYTYNTTITNAVTTTDTYDYALRTGNYQMSSLSMSGGTKLVVIGDAVLYIEGNFSMTGNAEVKIVPGASLKVYVGGSTSNFAGNGIFNETGDTTKFQYYGLPSNTSVSLSGNAAFTGTIYAPSADFSLNGGGNNTYDLVGASVSKTVDMHGHFRFHYDERLGRSGGKTQYRVASWNEL